MMGQRWLLWGVAGLTAAAPLLIGSAHPWTQVALSAVALALTGALAFLKRARGLRLAPFLPVALLALGWTLVQLVPLPMALVGALAPRAELLREPARWAPISLDVPATLLEAAKGFCYTGLFLVVATTARRSAKARLLLAVVVAVGATVGLISVVQRTVGASTILGFYRAESDPGSGYFGTFVNGNHAASLFALAWLIGLGLAFEVAGPARVACALGATFAAVGLLSTMSRGGAAGLAVGALLFLGTVLARRLGALRGWLAAALVTVFLASATLWAADGLRARLTASHETLWSNQKVRGWRAGLAMTREFAWTGVGRGAFEPAVNAYRADDESVRLVFPENLAVQIASEWGVPVALMLLVLFAAGLRALWPALTRLEVSTLAAGCGVVAVLVHELADFGLELPGVAIPTVVALGVVVARARERLSQARRAPSRPRARRIAPAALAAGLGAWALVLAGAAWAAPRTLAADFARCKQLSEARAPQADAALAEAMARHPADDHLVLLAARRAIVAQDVVAATRSLNRALLLHPSNARAHLLAARVLLQTGHRKQAALELRTAAELGALTPPEQLVAMLKDDALDGVRQRSDDLVGLARYAAAHGHHALALAAAARAVERGGVEEKPLLASLEVAVAAGDPTTVRASARRLLRARPGAAAYERAARALAGIGDAAAADDAMAEAMRAFPGDGSLLVSAAHLRAGRGDFLGARQLLSKAAAGTISLRTRLAVEELSVEIADKEGDLDAAALARARVRVLKRKIQETNELMP